MLEIFYCYLIHPSHPLVQSQKKMFVNQSVKCSLVHPQPLKPPPAAFIPFLACSLSSPHQTAVSQGVNGSEIIDVGNVHSNVFIEMGRPQYSFSFSLFATNNGLRKLISTVKIVKTFDELECMHKLIVKDLSPALADTLPDFPTTRWLSYSLSLEVLKQRQSFLKDYFVNLISCKSFLCCVAAHKRLNVPSRLSEYLVKLGSQD